MPKEYAKALFESLRHAKGDDAPDMLVERLIMLLRREGKVKMLPAILREYERLEEEGERGRPVIMVAKHADARAAQSAARAYLKDEADPSRLRRAESDAVEEDVEVLIDESLIGGWRLFGRNLLVDRSYKAALLKLYRSIVSA